jgi:hypothetical protein
MSGWSRSGSTGMSARPGVRSRRRRPTSALKSLDPSFVRAETALHVDLATALAATGEVAEARTHVDHAIRLAAQVGSARQRRRVKTLLATVR